VTKNLYIKKTRFYRLSVSLITAVLMFPSLSYSATTEEKLNACDLALTAKIQEASLCNLGVQLRTDEMARLNNENTELRKQGTSLLTNPVVWLALGVFLGGYAARR
jgi:hypothetical protein